MTVTVLDSRDLVESVITGTVPVPAGITEDNAAQAAKREAAKSDDAPKDTHVVQDNVEKAPQKAQEPAKAEAKTDAEADDIEGEDGLTPRQKREFTASMQKTIAKKHRMQKEAEELATAEYNRGRLAEERAARLERELTRLKEQTRPADVAAEDAGPPKREAFETDEAYREALIDYRVDQKFKAQEIEAQKRREEQAQAEAIAHAKARIERAIELVPDFKEVTEAVDMAVPPHIASYMQDSDMFAELGYHFAKNPEVLEKLTEYTANTRPGSADFVRGITRSLVELGKIESKLSPFASKAKVDSQESNAAEASQSNGAKPSTKTGSAPSKPRTAPIIRPLTAGTGAQIGKDEAEMKPSEVITAWQRKHGVKLTARKRH